MLSRYYQKVKRFFYFGQRTFDDYSKFLSEAMDEGYELAPLKKLVEKNQPGEKIIGLRHDVDSELDHSLKIGEIEWRLNVKSTYFVLHTAKYFYKDVKKDNLRDDLMDKLLYLQNDLGHEIGLHLDLLPIECIYGKDPAMYLKNILNLLRNAGIEVVGVAPHGNLYRNLYRKSYLSELNDEKHAFFLDPRTEFDLKNYDLMYDAYGLDHDLYFSDARFIEGRRWDFSMLDKEAFRTAERIIVSTHPIHWASSSFHYYTANLSITTMYFIKYLNEYRQYRATQ